MVAPSKVFEWPLNRVHCSGFLHSLPNQSCTEAFIWNLYRNHVSSAKYYLPVLLVPLVLNYRKLSKNHVWSIVKNYLQTLGIGSTINALVFYWMCICRRLCGRFVWGLVPFLSCCLGAQIIWWAPPKVLQFYSTGIIHAAIEAMMRQLDVGLVHSHAARTLVFMMCSLAVLRLQQAQAYSGFWFIKPALLPDDYPKWSLEQRVRDSLLELRTYLGIGLALDLLSAIMRKRIRRINLKSTSFMISYMGIYRMIQCVLAGRMEPRHTNLLAAFLSGGAFWFVSHIPLTLMSFSVVTASQVLWQEFCAQDVSKSKLLAKLQRLPWSKLLIPPSLGFLVHSLLFQGHVINGLARSFINRTCDSNAQRIVDFLLLPEETILTKVSSISIMPFLF
ncbi:uncharacterized protein LOC117791258 [Drosophila innubila]|uniref:uncharacterized protein LOC117791258 n=1 Tax=Drosophila innubila TaxID=198719 RepID=UPI00148D4F4A|nr:uncharacterized protein LOC117791258 [Drosophila innubila]